MPLCHPQDSIKVSLYVTEGRGGRGSLSTHVGAPDVNFFWISTFLLLLMCMQTMVLVAHAPDMDLKKRL
jgi:hypothetical protein